MPVKRTRVVPGNFLPMSRAEMDRLGWDSLDVLLVTGDAYVDHPAFGTALLGRLLQSHGFRVGVVAQPRWTTMTDVVALGRPRLFAGVTAGALDSMLAHYTAFRKLRHDDAYTPGGRHGARPNRATLVYTSLVRRAFPGLPVVIGGIEASLRRATHYDFWSDKLRRSILVDSQADLLVYGMAERAVIEIASRLRDSRPILGIPGTAFISPSPLVGEGRGEGYASSSPLEGVGRGEGHPSPSPLEGEGRGEGRLFSFPQRLSVLASQRLPPPDAPVIRLPSHEEIEADPRKLMEATLTLERQVHSGNSWAYQAVAGRTVVFAPPAEPLTTPELDQLYALPFTRLPHPSYREPIPAVEMIQFSITTHRGCGGGCSFCSLALHQGRRIRSRSRDSILAEAERLTRHADWKGRVTDVGGPTANMWGATCLADPSKCRRASCLFPTICPNFKADQPAIIELLRGVARLSGVKSVRVASGVRHDLALKDQDYVKALVGEFVGGQLKLAPEHNCDHVLRLMRKPAFRAFEQFLTIFESRSYRDEHKKEQYIVPYLISAFPGTTLADMRRLARWLRAKHWRPRQVQCFVPTPGTVATAMCYAGIDPEGNPIPVARTDAERLRQHRILRPTLGRPDN